jgi:hypothetical protein
MAAYILILLGFYCLASSVYDQCRGITSKAAAVAGPYYGKEAHSRYLYSTPTHKDQKPELYSTFMLARWVYAA